MTNKAATISPARRVGGRKPIVLSSIDRNIISASYDAAQTNDENTRHWAAADNLSALAAHSPHVRCILRKRCRYEVANSPLARGMLRRKADYIVGTGPRLHLKTRDRAYNRAVEQRFASWAIAIGLGRKLWQTVFSKSQNGEGFGIFFNNGGLRHPVKFDVRTIEADQVADPSFTSSDSDGIIFDDFGNVLGYRVLKTHPGDLFISMSGARTNDFDTWSAQDLYHYFDSERPGQVRGVPEITAALALFAMRRRYVLAVLAAAETAADIAMLIKSNYTVTDPENNPEPMDLIELERRMAMVLPEGWEGQGFKSDQPTTTFEMFDNAIIREIGRCIGMPFGIAAQASNDYNFASGKLDDRPWLQTVRIEQDHLDDAVVGPIYRRWFAEASRIPGYLPPPPQDALESIAVWGAPQHMWFWDGQDAPDPRESGAKATGLKHGFDFHGPIAAKRGEDILEQWEAQAELLGISLDEYRDHVIRSMFGVPEEADPEDKNNVNEETGNDKRDEPAGRRVSPRVKRGAAA